MKRVVHTKLNIYVHITTVFMKRVYTQSFMKRVVHTKLGIYVLITTQSS